MGTDGGGRTAGLVEGKRALVVGVANKRSIAWSIAQALDAAGAHVGLTFQNDRTEGDVRRLAETLTHETPVFQLDVQDDEMVQRSVDASAASLGGLDVLVHAVAFARADDLTGRFTAITREGFHLAMDVSAYSLLALAKAAEPHMRAAQGGSIMSLSYLAAERAVPGYNVMGIAKSALESITRYLAYDLGDAGIRVNAISAGPVRTLAARGIPGFSEMAGEIAGRTPLRREITVDEVGATGLYLASDLSTAVTGETLHVDAGYHAMGM